MASSSSRTSPGARPSIRSMNSSGISCPPCERLCERALLATDVRLRKFIREMPAVMHLCFSGMGGLERNRVELRHLRVFEAVARLESFTHAADELSITQPALSRTIRQLEDALGVTLLDRSSRHVETTPAGQTFLEHVERVLAELERAFGAVRQQASIRLGFSWLLPDPWAQQTVARFEQATGTTVSLVRTDDALAAVQQGRVNVAVVRGPVASGAADKPV